MTRWMLGFTTAVALASASPLAAGPAVPAAPSFATVAPAPWLAEDPADSLYRAGREALNRNQYRRAAELFAQVTAKYPRSGYAGDALYWQAFALYRAEDLNTALARLEEQKRRYPNAATAKDAEALAARIRGGLARRGDAEAAASLMSTAQDAAAAERTGAAVTVTGPGERRRSACDDDSDVKLAALNAVMQMDAERAMPLLSKVLAKRDPGSVCLRRKAVFLVAQKRTDSSEVVLMNSVRNDPDPEVREQAVFWLSQVPGPRTVTLLDSLARYSNDEQLQERAVFALSQHGDERAAAALRAVAERRDAPVGTREKAIFWLGQSKAGGPAYLRTLYPKLENDALRERAIFAIAQSNRPEDKRWLLDLVLEGRTSTEIKKRALFWAGQEASPQELEGLYKSLPERELKEQVIFALSQRKDPGAVDQLVVIAKSDKDPELRKRALFWLGQSNDPRVADIIEQMLDE